MLAITLGYGFIYTCRLGLSIVKKPLIDGGVFSVEELGMIGGALLYGYAFGKFFNGFLADHFRPRLFFSAAILIYHRRGCTRIPSLTDPTRDMFFHGKISPTC